MLKHTKSPRPRRLHDASNHTHTLTHWLIRVTHSIPPRTIISQKSFKDFSGPIQSLLVKSNPNQDIRQHIHTAARHASQKSLHTNIIQCLVHTWRPWPYPPSSTWAQGQTHRRRAISINVCHGKHLINWCDIFVFQTVGCLRTRYLFEPSVLDVELLRVNKVEKFAVLFSRGKGERERWALLHSIHSDEIRAGKYDLI